jgi:hypothetical protein
VPFDPGNGFWYPAGVKRTRIASLVVLLAMAVTVEQAAADRFAEIDQHALRAPASVTASAEQLAAYLSQGLSSETDKARAAYRWVTDSVAYDTNAFFTGARADESVEGVLASRRGVCAGYSRLYAEICRRMGLTVETVSGYAKGYGYAPGAVFVGTNHDWNAVLIDGAWQLMDCTWGAGHVGTDKRFVKEYTDFFFMPPPFRFILSHLPENPRWQLLDTAWTKEQFAEGVFVYPPAYSLGIDARSHTKAVFPSSGRERLLFDAPPGVLAIASVDGNDNGALTQIVEGGFEVLCAFANAGRHTLSIYATTRDSTRDRYSAVMSYAVEVAQGLGETADFPSSYSNYTARRVTLVEPFTRILAAGSSVAFRLSIPDAVKVAVINAGTWSYLPRQEGQFSGSVPVSPGRVSLCAQFPDRDGYEGILDYTAR